VGRALSGAVTAYNQTVGSLESRVLVSARRLQQLGLVETGQEAPRIVEETTRVLSAPELTVSMVPAPAAAPAALEPALPDRTTAADPATGLDLAGAPAELFAAHANGAAT
jgi:DNA recombination protein RmuC